MVRSLVLAAPLALLVACDRTPEETGPQTMPLAIGPGFSTTEIDWAESDAVTRLAYAVRQNGAVTDLCGAVATVGDPAIAAFEPQVLRAGRVAAGDTVIAPDLAFFARRATVEPGTLSNCLTTTVPWNAAWASEPPQLTIAAEAFAAG